MPSLVHGRLCIFGKAPARADFIDQGLPPPLRHLWEEWVQDGLAAGQRVHHARWRQTMANAPKWRLYLPPELSAGTPALLGVMLPSTDSVGRPYPLLLGVLLPSAADPVRLIAGSARWFAAVEALGEEAMAPDFDLTQLSRRLLPRLSPVELAAADHPAGSSHSTPRPAQPAAPRIAVLPMATAAAPLAHSLCRVSPSQLALFWSSGGNTAPPMLAALPALVPERLFPALIDGHWRGHGWPLAEAGSAPAHALTTGRAWDREA